MMSSERWHPRNWELDNSSCRVLRYLSKDGTWDNSAVEADWKSNTELIREVIRSRRTTPVIKSTHPGVLFAVRINKELARPGTDSEIGLILAAAAGDLEKTKAMTSSMLQRFQVPPICDMAFVAILGPHANVLKYCVEQHLQIDNNLAWAAANYLNAEILEILFPLNIFGIKRHSEFLEGILDEVLILGKYRGKTTNSADALSLAKFLVKQGAKITGAVIATAAKEQSINFMKFILLHCDGVDLSECGALHMAVVEKKLEMVNLLLDQGCDPNKMHHYCAVLVDRNTYDDYGYPLNYAVSRRDVDMVRALVAKGANPKLSCDAGHDAFAYLRGDKGVDAGRIRELLNQETTVERHVVFDEAMRR